MKWVRRIRWIPLLLLACWLQFGAVEWWTGFIIDDLVCSSDVLKGERSVYGLFSGHEYVGRTVCVVGYDDDYVYLYQPGFRQTSFGRIRTLKSDGVWPYLWGAKFHVAGWNGTLDGLGCTFPKENKVVEPEPAYDGPVGRFTGFASPIAMMPGIWLFLYDKDSFH